MEEPNEVTEKKLAANRRNAQLSTGPKDTSLTRHNALKHGILAKEVVIDIGEGLENQEEFDHMFEALWEYFKPEGPLEEILVERIAVSYWRLRRVLRYEIGEIRSKLDTADFDLFCKWIEDVERNTGLGIPMQSKRTLLRSSFGIQQLLRVLADVRGDVEENGFLSEASVDALISSFPTREHGFAHWLYTLSGMATEGPKMAQEEPEQVDDTPPPEKCKEAMLKEIDEQKEWLERLAESATENEGLKLESNAASLALPSREAVDKIVRYEAAIERHFYRALAHLERAQRARKGELVQPPVSIDVQVEGR